MASLPIVVDRAHRYYQRRLRPTALAHRLVDWQWSRNPPRVVRAEPTWPVPADAGRQLTVTWPDRYPNPIAKLLCDPLRAALDRHVPVQRAPIDQRHIGALVVRVHLAGTAHDVVIDYGDYRDLRSDTVRAGDLVFKMQYDRSGYGRSDVVPVGHAIGGAVLLTQLPRFRARTAQPARYDVYGRFSPNFAPELRRQAVQMLSRQTRFGFKGGLSIAGYTQFLREAAAARVVIDLPGQGDFCTRLTDMLALGVCVVAWPHRTSFHVPLVPGEHLAVTEPDLSDLVDVCAALIEDDERRARIAAAGRDFFDRYLHPDQVAGYVIQVLMQRLGRD